MMSGPRTASAVRRARLPFRAVNLRGRPGYLPGVQRHHLLPRQILLRGCFCRLFDALGEDHLGIDDFRTNGLLLPATEQSVVRMRLPLHRGPHRLYNDMVEGRIGQIERDWSVDRSSDARRAAEKATMRLGLLQRALRRRLLYAASRPIRLNRHDPLGRNVDFTALDAMVEALWAAVEVEQVR